MFDKTNNVPSLLADVNDVTQFQDPTEAYSLLKTQKGLSDTKEILHMAIAKVLDRGEKLEDLVSKSETLSASSKIFYKQAKKTNSFANCSDT